MNPGRGEFWALALLGLAIAAIPTAVAAASATVNEPTSVALVAVGVLLVWAVGLAMWARPRDRRLARLLFLLAVTYSIRGLAASDNPWVFSLARALGQVAEFVLVWVMLAFPTGRLRSRGDRLIVMVGAFAATALWIPTVMLSADVPLAGPLVPCDLDCPENALLIANDPGLAALFEATFRAVSIGVLVATALSLTNRLLRASALTRRTLAPVLVTSIARTLGIAAFVISAGTRLSGLVLVVLFWAIPLSMALGLLLGRLHTAAVLQRLVSGLQRGPDDRQLRSVLAEALEDPTLQISYWLPDDQRWAQADGTLTDVPSPPATGQAVTITSLADGTPVAALAHDEALLDEPDLLEAVTASTRLALESNRVRAELALSDARIADEGARARREFERDLHDGAQQRLIALRMKASVLRRLFDQDVSRAAALAAELGPDIDATLAEVRDLAHGRGTRLLDALGLGAALDGLAARASLPTTVRAGGITRYTPDVEAAVYFACSEALQNAAKHAGAGAHAEVVVIDDGVALTFRVADDGPGSSATSSGEGLGNLRERLASVGGTIAVESAPGAGFCVTGRIPIT